jgi:uncharacterized membrane protein YphA (DoxX/SURF4 family)
MATTVFFIRWDDGFFMRSVLDAGGRAAAGGYEYALLILVATISVSLLGAGAFAVDRATHRPRRFSMP